MAKRVSAIVSAYYAELYLEGRIKNLQAQMPHPEIVVICQAGSAEERIARECEADQVITTEDIPTVYAAWNIGIEHATGEYLTSANSDDRFYPDALMVMQAALEQNDAALVYADVDIVSEIGGAPTGRYAWREGGLAELLEGCFIGPMPLWRKSLHEKYGMFDAAMHSAGDYEFWLRLAEGKEKFFHVRRVLGAYLYRKDSVEHRESLRSVVETARARSKHGGNWI